jgi:hypothetical protein
MNVNKFFQFLTNEANDDLRCKNLHQVLFENELLKAEIVVINSNERKVTLSYCVVFDNFYYRQELTFIEPTKTFVEFFYKNLRKYYINLAMKNKNVYDDMKLKKTFCFFYKQGDQVLDLEEVEYKFEKEYNCIEKIRKQIIFNTKNEEVDLDYEEDTLHQINFTLTEDDLGYVDKSEKLLKRLNERKLRSLKNWPAIIEYIRINNKRLYAEYEEYVNRFCPTYEFEIFLKNSVRTCVGNSKESELMKKLVNFFGSEECINIDKLFSRIEHYEKVINDINNECNVKINELQEERIQLISGFGKSQEQEEHINKLTESLMLKESEHLVMRLKLEEISGLKTLTENDKKELKFTLDRITIEKNESVESYRKLLEFYLKYKNFKLHEISKEATEGMYQDYVKFSSANNFTIMPFEEFIQYDTVKNKQQDLEYKKRAEDIYWEDYNSDDEDSYETQIREAPYFYSREQLINRVQECNRILAKTKDYNPEGIASKEQYYKILKSAKYFEDELFKIQNKRSDYEKHLEEEMITLKRKHEEELSKIAMKIKINEKKFMTEHAFLTGKIKMLETQLAKNSEKDKPSYEGKYIGKLEEELKRKDATIIEALAKVEYLKNQLVQFQKNAVVKKQEQTVVVKKQEQIEPKVIGSHHLEVKIAALEKHIIEMTEEYNKNMQLYSATKTNQVTGQTVFKNVKLLLEEWTRKKIVYGEEDSKDRKLKDDFLDYGRMHLGLKEDWVKKK